MYFRSNDFNVRQHSVLLVLAGTNTVAFRQIDRAHTTPTRVAVRRRVEWCRPSIDVSRVSKIPRASGFIHGRESGFDSFSIP
jgi:hypothetical protein